MAVHTFDLELYRRRTFGAHGPVGVVSAQAAAGAPPVATPIDAMVLDVSNYDWATFDAACLYASGVRRLVVGCQDERIARAMIDAATSEGIDVIALYALVYFGGSSWHLFDDVEACLRVQADYGVRAIALDAEIDAATIWPEQPSPAGPSQRNGELLRCRRMVEAAGGRALVYTNASWWVPRHGNTTAFADLGLWYPHYGWGGTLRTPIREVAFGGWTSCVAHQAGSTYEVCGRGRDVNYLWEDLEEDDAVTRTEYEDLVLGMWSGSEERYTREEAVAAGDASLEGQTMPREVRLERALYRSGEVAAGRAQSLGQRTAQGGGGAVVVPAGTVLRVPGGLVVQ